MLRRAIACVLLVVATTTAAEEIYLSTDAFVARAFDGDPPPARVLWIDAPLRDALTETLGHPPDMLRLRYWADADRSAWVLEEIGKEKPITLGVTVHDRAIERVDVLAFRESRGWEIRYPFFTRQFEGIRLDGNGALDRNVDGITGATLSVRAAKRVAAAALTLDARIRESVPVAAAAGIGSAR